MTGRAAVSGRRPSWLPPVVLMTGLLAGCTVGPDYKAPRLDALAGWAERTPKDAASHAIAERRLRRWWSLFNDRTLDRLVEEAAASNPQVRIAAERLLQARETRYQASIADYPTVDFSVLGQNDRSSERVQWPPGIGDYRTYQFGVDASWEIDVFGRNRRSLQAAEAETEVGIETQRDVLVSLLAELATDYVALRASQERIAIAQRNVDAETRSLHLVQVAFDHGLTNDLAVAQARAAVETTAAALPPLHAEVARLAHAIAVLLGREPGALEGELERPGRLVPVPSNLPVWLPSDVVRQRPDIRAAERRIASATARVGVAVADMFPRVRIPLSIGPAASTVHQLFTTVALMWQAGVTTSQLVYDAGRTSSRVRAARALTEEQRIMYQQTVLNAFRDVEDALVTYSTDGERHALQAAAVADNRRAFDRASRLYGAGLTDFLHVLDAERAMFQSEDSLAQSDFARVRDTITLFKALGGGWQDYDGTRIVPVARLARDPHARRPGRAATE